MAEAGYDTLENKIRTRAVPGIAAHEYGHFVDYNATSLLRHGKKRKVPISMIRFAKIAEKYVEDQKWARRVIDDVLKEFLEKELLSKDYAAFQDIINALTKGNKELCWYHRKSYWRLVGSSRPNYENICTEVFADLFELYTRSRQKSARKQIEFIKKHFPDLWKEFERVLKNLAGR